MERRVVLEVLQELEEDDFECFKFYLTEPDILRENESISKSELEQAIRFKTMKLMFNKYEPRKVLEITEKIFITMKRNDLVQLYSSKLKAFVLKEAVDGSKPEGNETERGKLKSATSENLDKVVPELTLVLIGDTSSIKIGPNNILIDHNEQTLEPFSAKLYDLCGRRISVINMLGLKQVPLKQGIHAFVLLVTNGPHTERYRSGLQWMKQTFGTESLSHVLTVVTHESDENCEDAVTDLRTNSSLNETRFHTCSRGMTDGNEIIELMEKIDSMVSDNHPDCYNRKMIDKHKEQKKQLEPRNEHAESSVIQQNESVKEAQAIDTENKCDPLNEAGEVGHRTPDNTAVGDSLHLNTSGKKNKQPEMGKKNKLQETTETLFNRLYLQNRLQQKMSPDDYLKIFRSVKLGNDTAEKDLTETFLQRLMLLDYRARYIPAQQGHLVSGTLSENVNTKDNLENALFSNVADTVKSTQTHVHPMDVQMAVFLCSDSFLQQNMVTKLSQCQYALPLLVPHPLTGDVEFPLWTFRQIIKTWKTPSTMKSVPVYKAQTPMVSFLRLGSLSVSKSQLMNDLINERHSTFFHRNCAGSTKRRLLMDGVAEIAWYCPAGKPNDAFTDCIAFCNLHGDALEFERQREILVGKSSVNVVLVPTLEKGDKGSAIITELYKAEKPLVVLIANTDFGTVKMKEGKYKIGLKDITCPHISEELKKIIGNILSGQHESFQLETLAEVSGLRVDEDDPACHNGKAAAMNIVKLFKGKDVSNIKDEFLRCQGELWHNWCRINKELYHLKGNIEMEKCKKQQELMQIRRDQCRASCSEVMKLFINSLSSLPSPDKEYFLKWTQILIDALSSDDPSTATFGLEHIFREMGQIYEAHKSLHKQPEEVLNDWSKYPELAAELMISGHPMELMDGDAGHVPLTWVSSVLDEVRRKLGDRSVFVLSVLGVQSSGKSTMLNAVFGLQFAVSAGRCTKGAFMQLVKVSEEMKDLTFDYVLVVDTEGLRALELEGNNTLHHDNELATFVVGVGNMTLINIFGENPVVIDDILQIVVQAFMRMKKVKLSPSCVFVHQNVTDITATERNMDGKRRLQEKLDQMVQLAAKEEDSDAKCFSEIIAFDVQTDVKYFAQLWEGSPPMAPPNPGYSESVQELKDVILSKASRSDGVTLSQFSVKIQDLWNALMIENFVFSFKNTLEISVYRKLEVQYGNWTWTLRSNMLTIENQLYTRIENGKLDKVDSSFIHKEISETYEEIKNDMTKYFEDEKDKEMLVQWRNQFETKIKEFHNEQVREVKRKLDEVLQQKKACKKWDDTKTEFETMLLQKSKELAQQLREKAKNEEELKKHFNSVWSSWVRELTAGIKPVEDIDLEEDQSRILQELGFEWKLVDDRKKKLTYKNTADLKDYSGYVSKSLWKVWPQSTLPPEEKNQIITFIDRVEKQSMDKFKSKPVAIRGFSSSYLQEVAKDVKEKVAEFESQKKYSLKKEFTVDLCLFVFDRAESWFTESHKKFKMKNDPHVFLETKREQYYNVFSSYCKGASSAVVLGGLICENLKVSIIEAICNQTAIDLARDMRCDYPAFNGNRLDLEKHVLKSLAEKEDFDDFMNYIRHPRKHVESFIEEQVEKYIFTEHKDKALEILKKNVEDVKKLVSRALFTATDKVKAQRGNTNMWLKTFSALIKDKLTFDPMCSQNFSDISDFDHLKDEVETGLTSIVREMSSLSLDKMKDFRLQPDQILIDQLCSCCWVQCPFCRAVCTNTLENHDGDHSVPFHKSTAVNGVHYRGTVEMTIEFCTTKVACDGSFYLSHDSDQLIPYKLYRTAGPRYENWRITPDGSNLPYWKWFVCRFQSNLEEYYDKKFKGKGEIPREWKTYCMQDAIKSLDEMCRSVDSNPAQLKI